jgi:Lon protease-like protein
MPRNPFLPKFSDLPRELPVFPLAGAVVMPGVQLPLNIFEPRYLSMVRDALKADHLIGMLQPRPDTSFDEAPEIHQVGCAGRISSYSETNDGRIVLILTGVCRFQVAEELAIRRGYRRVRPDWERFAIDYHPSEEVLPGREDFMTSLRAYCTLREVEVPWDDVGKMGDAELVNLLCAHLPLDPEDKQALIETVDLCGRGQLMAGLMDMASAAGAGTLGQRH